MDFPQSPEPNTQPLRILEIGSLGSSGLFVDAVPAQTQFYWTGAKRRDRDQYSFGPLRMLRSLAKLRRREFDLLVVHTTQYPPWHPRSILTALRDWHYRPLRGLFGLFAWRFTHLFHSVPIAVVDLRDSCHIGRHNFFLLDSCVAFFKRELPTDNWLAFCKSSYPNFPGRKWRSFARNRRRVEKLKPISLGFYSHFEGAAAPVKSADIFFAGRIGSNNTARVAGFKELQALKAEGYVVDIATEPLAWPEYMRRMSAAWLAWSPGGLGWDCYRHYEAPLAGTAPLMNHPAIVRHRPLKDGEQCVLYGVEAGGLTEAVRRALADKAALHKMAKAGAEHILKHHSRFALAEYVTTTVLGRRLDGSRYERNMDS